MSETELLKEIEELKSKNAFLEKLLERKIHSTNIKAYEIVARLVANKVWSETNENIGGNVRSALKRKIMDDMKWDLRVRRATDFVAEDVPRVEEYLKKYEIDEQYKKSV